MTHDEKRMISQSARKIAELEARLYALTEIVESLKPRKRGRPAAVKQLEHDRHAV